MTLQSIDWSAASSRTDFNASLKAHADDCDVTSEDDVTPRDVLTTMSEESSWYEDSCQLLEKNLLEQDENFIISTVELPVQCNTVVFFQIYSFIFLA